MPNTINSERFSYNYIQDCFSLRGVLNGSEIIIMWCIITTPHFNTTSMLLLFLTLGLICVIFLLCCFIASRFSKYWSTLYIDDNMLKLYNCKNQCYAEISLTDITGVTDTSTKVNLNHSIEVSGKRKDYFTILPNISGYSRLIKRLRSLPNVRDGIMPCNEWKLIYYGVTLFYTLPMAGCFLITKQIFDPSFFLAKGVVGIYNGIAAGMLALIIALGVREFLNTPTKIESKNIQEFYLTRGLIRKQLVKNDDILAVNYVPASWRKPEHYNVELRNGQFNIYPGAYEHSFDLVEYLEYHVQK